jgi:hypothetical protein
MDAPRHGACVRPWPPLGRPPDPIRTPSPQGPLARPFFILRDRREKTSATDSRAPARASGLRSGDRRISLARTDEPSGSRRRRCWDSGHRPLSEDHDQGQAVPSTPTGLAAHDRQLVPGDDRPPRRKPVEQSLGQSASRNHIAKQCEPTRASKQQVRIQGRGAKRHRTMARRDLQERAKAPSRQFRNAASRPRCLCGGRAQAVRRICPDGVDGIGGG